MFRKRIHPIFNRMKWDREPLAPIPGRRSSDDDAPSGWDRWREVAWHVPRLLAGLGPLGPRGPEDGPPALVIPGFLATDRTTMELRRALARAGWRSHPWLLGMNGGAKINTMELLASRLEAIWEEARQPDPPRRLEPWRHVRATAGQPPSGEDPRGGDARLALFRQPQDQHQRPRILRADRRPRRRPAPVRTDRRQPPVPTLALWSRRDGIVAPAAARGLPRKATRR